MSQTNKSVDHGQNTPGFPNTTRDTFMNKYTCVQELILRLFRDVSLGRLCSNSLIASATTTSRNLTPAPGVVRLHVNGFYFSTTARRVTSTTLVPHLYVNRPLKVHLITNTSSNFKSANFNYEPQKILDRNHFMEAKVFHRSAELSRVTGYNLNHMC